MSKQVWVFTEGDEVHTMSSTGEVRVYVVERDGTMRTSEELAGSPWAHVSHHPVQHRDGHPPWCNICGWTSPQPAVPAKHIKDRS